MRNGMALVLLTHRNSGDGLFNESFLISACGQGPAATSVKRSRIAGN